MGGGSFAYVPAEYQRPQPSIIERSIALYWVSYVYVMRKCISFYKVLFLLDGWENEMTHPAQKKLWTGRLWSIRTLMSLMERRIMILELASLSFWLFIYWSVDVLESFSDVHLAFLIYSSLVRWLMCTLSISLMDTCVLVPVALMPIPSLHNVFLWISCATQRLSRTDGVRTLPMY